MKRAKWILLPLLLIGASQINSDVDTTPYYCEFRVDEGAAGVTPGTDSASCTTLGVTPGLLATTAENGKFYVPPNQRLTIREWGTMVVGGTALVATEDCNLVLIFDTTPAGAGSIASTLTTGPGATETECTAGSTIVDAIGESCVINNFTTMIPGGGYWRICWGDNDNGAGCAAAGGGANTCTAWNGGMVWVRGLLSPQ